MQVVASAIHYIPFCFINISIENIHGTCDSVSLLELCDIKQEHLTRGIDHLPISRITLKQDN